MDMVINRKTLPLLGFQPRNSVMLLSSFSRKLLAKLSSYSEAPQPFLKED
jgi:hypothetical protein